VSWGKDHIHVCHDIPVEIEWVHPIPGEYPMAKHAALARYQVCNCGHWRLVRVPDPAREPAGD
jgi:hypothetical protein